MPEPGPKKYRIVSGSFRVSDKETRGVGDEIELDDDVAQANAHMIEPIESAEDAPVGNQGHEQQPA